MKAIIGIGAVAVLLCVGYAVLSAKAGPATTTQGELTPVKGSVAPLALEIQVVAGAAGGPLAVGEIGWVILSLRNTSEKPIAIPTIVFTGKGRPGREPAGGNFPFYSGFDVAHLSVSWVNHQGIPESQVLPPPDDVIALKPGQRRDMARVLRAPDKPGLYTLRARFDTGPTVKALATFNIVIVPEPFCIETTMANVSVVPRP